MHKYEYGGEERSDIRYYSLNYIADRIGVAPKSISYFIDSLGSADPRSSEYDSLKDELIDKGLLVIAGPHSPYRGKWIGSADVVRFFAVQRIKTPSNIRFSLLEYIAKQEEEYAKSHKSLFDAHESDSTQQNNGIPSFDDIENVVFEKWILIVSEKYGVNDPADIMKAINIQTEDDKEMAARIGLLVKKQKQIKTLYGEDEIHAYYVTAVGQFLYDHMLKQKLAIKL